MNRIYKTIWSKTKQCYIVVPETAKSVTRSKGKMGAAILAATVAVMGIGGVQAANYTIADGYGVLVINGGDKPSPGPAASGGATSLADGSITMGSNTINNNYTNSGYLKGVVIGSEARSQGIGASVSLGPKAITGIPLKKRCDRGN